MARTWTAEDISKTGPIKITEVSPGRIRFYQPYHFLDANGNPLEEIKEDKTIEDVEWIDLPEDIRASLLTIREYLYQKALTKHQMNEGA